MDAHYRRISPTFSELLLKVYQHRKLDVVQSIHHGWLLAFSDVFCSTVLSESFYGLTHMICPCNVISVTELVPFTLGLK